MKYKEHSSNIDINAAPPVCRASNISTLLFVPLCTSTIEFDQSLVSVNFVT